MTQMTRDQVLQNLEEIRAQHGEADYLKARHNLALMLILQPQGDEFLKSAFPELDLAPVREEAERNKAVRGATTPDAMLDLIRTHVPSIKTQKQYDIFITGFEAFTLALEAYFSGRADVAEKASSALSQILDTAKQYRAVEAQVSEIPEDQRSPSAAKFVAPAGQFTEVQEQQQLLLELDSLGTYDQLEAWYKQNRQRIESVVTKRYRDDLFDAIRSKKHSLYETRP